MLIYLFNNNIRFKFNKFIIREVFFVKGIFFLVFEVKKISFSFKVLKNSVLISMAIKYLKIEFNINLLLRAIKFHQK